MEDQTHFSDRQGCPNVSNPRGRPRCAAAASHEAILDAVYELLQEKSVRDVSIEQIARRAGVGKPTIYKWWPSKAALVMDMFEERLMGCLSIPDGKSAEEVIRLQVAEMICVLNGFFGKVAADIIAEGQSEPEVLKEYRERYLCHRRAFTTQVIEKARNSGEFTREIDPALFIDLIYGPIYYRLLVGHLPLDQQFGADLVAQLMTLVK